LFPDAQEHFFDDVGSILIIWNHALHDAPNQCLKTLDERLQGLFVTALNSLHEFGIRGFTERATSGSGFPPKGLGILIVECGKHNGFFASRIFGFSPSSSSFLLVDQWVSGFSMTFFDIDICQIDEMPWRPT
jgi:hypothetical protein